MICFNSNIISILNYTNPYLASQVSARGIPKKDISMFHSQKTSQYSHERFFSITLKRSARFMRS